MNSCDNYRCGNYNKEKKVENDDWKMRIKCSNCDSLSFSRKFIGSGYLDIEGVNPDVQLRHTCLEYLKCFKGKMKSKLYVLTTLHNETLNIYTHLIPLCTILVLTIKDIFFVNNKDSSDILTVDFYDNPIIDDYVMYLFIASIMCCLMCSTYYHIECCIQPSIQPKLLKIDMFGVWCLIAGSFIAGLYYIYDPYPTLQIFYLTLFGGFLTLVMVPMLFIWPEKSSFKVKSVSMAIFIGCGIIPSAHWAICLSTINEIKAFWFGPVYMFGFYFIGFIIFHFHIPERWSKYKFDIIGNSHQIWHICILIAAISWWLALNNIILLRRSIAC